MIDSAREAGREIRQEQRKQWFAASAAILGWLGLGLQLLVIIQRMQASGQDIAGGIIRFLSYFTIWTNLLAALALTCAALNLQRGFARIVTRPVSMTGIACCIALVAIAYHVLLRGLWHLTGTHLLADNLLHYVVPALFLIFWWLFVAPAQAGWRDVMHWAMLPIIYFAFALLRGAFSGFYTYPFINVAQLGYLRVLINAAGVLLVFFGIAAILLWLDKRKR